LAALAQTDIKRLVAYSSVSHMGFIVLGMFALNATGLDGSAIQMINHGLTTGALFACVGMIYDRYHTRDITRIGGLWNRLPILAGFLILAALGSAALPGLNGFVGEFPILAGMFATSARAAVLGATGMILGACYLMWLLQKVVFGPLHEPAVEAAQGAAPAHGASAHGAVAPIGWHEIAGMAPILTLVVAIGVYPRPFMEQIRPAVARLDANLQSQRALARKQAAASLIPRTAPSARRGGNATKTTKGQGQRTGAVPKTKGGTVKPAETNKRGPAAPDTKPEKNGP
jgi:NADH-quinone oxidoreductase subunit M